MLTRDFVLWLSTKKKLTDAIARRGMKQGFARRFVAGETLADVIAASAPLGRAGYAVSLNHLGENVSTREQAEQARSSYVQMLGALDQAQLTGNISVKPTQLGLDLGTDFCQSLTIEIAEEAKRLGRTIELDMEGSAYTDRTLDIYEAVQRRAGNAGVALQAYLRRTAADVDRLRPSAPKIRLVKGAYREPAAIAFQSKREVDANYCLLLDRLLVPENKRRIFAAIGTHDPAMIEHAQHLINEHDLRRAHYEFQMIYGIRRDLQRQLLAAGHPLQIYVPFGVDWCPYFMRRLAERPANCWFVLRSLFAESKAENKNV
ncbi:MAG: proline dehydrogenase family protein [Candidatus Acidiferrales bacterium]